MPEWFSNLEVQWEEPALARSLESLGAFATVLMVDKRGVGLAGPVDPDHLPTLRDWCDDIVAVVDEVGARPLSIVAAGGAGPLAIELATHPDLDVDRLALLGTSARFRRAPDYPIGMDDEALDVAASVTRDLWGSGRMLDLGAPDRSIDRSMRGWFARYERMSASPDVAAAMQQLLVDVDVRSKLADITVPTLIIHRRDDRVIPASHGHFLAEHVPQTTFIELPGDSHLCFGDAPMEWLDELRAFHTGSRTAQLFDRRVLTVLFTDIVSSTEIASRMGDSRWREVLEKHDRIAGAEISAHGGTVVDLEGDGVLARFDSPTDAINAAIKLQRALSSLEICVRAGVHTGEVEIRHNEIAGLTVHIGARVADTAAADEVIVSRTVRDLLLGSRFEFEGRGSQILKGVPGEWELFEVVSQG